MVLGINLKILKIFIKKYYTGETLLNKIIFGQKPSKILKVLNINDLTNINI
jgi:hypothetical protein